MTAPDAWQQRKRTTCVSMSQGCGFMQPCSNNAHAAVSMPRHALPTRAARTHQLEWDHPKSRASTPHPRYHRPRRHGLSPQPPAVQTGTVRPQRTTRQQHRQLSTTQSPECARSMPMQSRASRKHMAPAARPVTHTRTHLVIIRKPGADTAGIWKRTTHDSGKHYHPCSVTRKPRTARQPSLFMRLHSSPRQAYGLLRLRTHRQHNPMTT